jgi:hypothetical protein
VYIVLHPRRLPTRYSRMESKYTSMVLPTLIWLCTASLLRPRANEPRRAWRCRTLEGPVKMDGAGALSAALHESKPGMCKFCADEPLQRQFSLYFSQSVLPREIPVMSFPGSRYRDEWEREFDMSLQT